MQIAMVVKALQDFKPSTQHFSGLGYDGGGNHVGRVMTITRGGPFSSYAKQCEGMLK
jgi:hypothetical protein